MKDDQRTKHTAEVVAHLEEEDIDLNLVRLVSGDQSPLLAQRQQIERLRRERGQGFYSDLIFALLGWRYSQEEAWTVWKEITAHRDSLTEALGRNPGIVVAALDFLTNCRMDKIIELRLIASEKLDDMLERSVVDGLTSLYDHDTFLTLLEKEIERSKRYSISVSLVLLDLDDFKRINDEYGHQKGDEVLVRVGSIIQDTIRNMDIAGRYGGEEFAVILPDAGREATTQIAERLRKTVEVQLIDDVGLTISVGVASYPIAGDDLDTLVEAADRALYQAKSEGKNRVVTATLALERQPK